MTYGCTKNEKEEAKRLQEVRKLRKDEEMAWPDWEEARMIENGESRLEPEGEAEVPEIIILSDAVEGTSVNLDGGSLQKEQKEIHQRKWKRTKGVNRTEMRKEEKRLRCALLNGSAWSTERKHMRRYKGTFDVFFGIEHRSRKEEMEEQFNREAKNGWRFAASAVRITEEMAGDEDGKRTSGGVFVAIDSDLGAVVGAEEGAIESIPGNEGRIAQAWVNVRGGLRIFSVYFWQSEGWSSRNDHFGSSSEKNSDHKASMADSV